MSTRATNPRGHVAGIATRRASGHVHRWEGQAICGEPAQVQDTVEIILQPVYDPFGRVVDHLPVAVPKSVWTYNFGSSRLIYFLTFRDGKLAHIETGGYGH